MRKRGQLRKGFVELILLWMLIGLFLLAAAFYFFRADEGEVTKLYFRELVSTIRDLEEGEVTELKGFFIRDGWLIKGYDEGDNSPESCSGKSCLCICKKGYWRTFWKDDCKKAGFCKLVEKDVRLQEGEAVRKLKLEADWYNLFISSNGFTTISEEKLKEEYADVKDIEFQERPKPEELTEEELVKIEEKSKRNVLLAMNYAKENTVHDRKCFCGDRCEEYAGWIVKYSMKYEIVDPLLSLSLMMQESSCKRTADNGIACGLMQIRYDDKSQEYKSKCFDPEENIKEGMKILKGKYDRFPEGRKFECDGRSEIYEGWYAAIRGYNGWGCTKEMEEGKDEGQLWFVEKVFKKYRLISEYVREQVG